MSFGDTTSTGMTSLTGNQNSARSVSAFFDSREHADAARRDLMAAGIPDSAITHDRGVPKPRRGEQDGHIGLPRGRVLGEPQGTLHA